MIDDYLPDEIQQSILQAAEKALPNEMCGFVAGLPFGYEFWECGNIAPNPTESFEMDWDFMTYYDSMIVAVVHSHPKGEPFLSGADRQAQVAGGLPWILASSGSLKLFRPVPHLRGREFVYDTADCCRLIQDAYHLCGLDLPDCPRIDLDADIAQQTLLNYFKHSDVFEMIWESNHKWQAGDVILTASDGDNPDHAMLYLGNDEILHHVHGQLSRREPYHRYYQRKTHSVWRHRKWQPEMTAAIFNDLLHSN